MTTATIETHASRGDLANGDFNAGAVLRRSVIPDFLHKVGDCTWRRKYAALTLTVADKTYDLPTEFDKMVAVFAPGSSSSTTYDNEMKNISEDPRLIARAEATSPQSNGLPSAYYIILDSRTPSEWKAIKFDTAPDYAYVIPYIYLPSPHWVDDTTSAELSTWIPNPLSWALVEGLRAELYLDRFGQQDPRYGAQVKRYENWIVTARSFKTSLGARNYWTGVRP